MKVVVAIDSFKGSLSSMEAGNAAKEGILKACSADVVVKPLADGGEGTTEALVEGLGGTYVTLPVTGPMGSRVIAKYGVMEDGKTAVMEMAQASGIILVERDALDPWRASTTGVGEMIKDAAARGCREFLIGIGGSATTEGGIGMLQALGFRFYDERGSVLPPVFGPQKGVKEQERQAMDDAMRHFAKKTAEFTGTDQSPVPGAGASGGLGFAFLSYLPNVELKSGIDIVLKAVGLEREVRDADIVVTGEGRLDAQTAMGKVPVGVARLAKKYGCKVVAFAGGVTEEAGVCNAQGIDAFFPIVRGVTTLEAAMEKETAKRNMALCAEQVFRLLQGGLNPGAFNGII